MLSLLFFILIASVVTYAKDLTRGYITYEELDGNPYNLTITQRNFFINNVPTLFLSTTIDYFRVPMDLWETVIKKAKSNHFNVIQIPVHWNVHQDEQSDILFHDNRHLFLFLEICKHNGLFVNLELGPYFTDNYRNNGYPRWYVYDNIINTRDDSFNAIQKWFTYLNSKLSSYWLDNGGPILFKTFTPEDSINKLNVTCINQLIKTFDNTALNIIRSDNIYENAIISCAKRDCTNEISYIFGTHTQERNPAIWIENQTGKQKWGDMYHEQYPFVASAAQRGIFQYGILIFQWFYEGGRYHNLHMFMGGSSFERYGAYLYTNTYMENGILKFDGSYNEPFHSYIYNINNLIITMSTSIIDADKQECPFMIEKLACFSFVHNDGRPIYTILHNLKNEEIQYEEDESVFAIQSFTLLPRTLYVADAEGNIIFNSKDVVNIEQHRKYNNPIALKFSYIHLLTRSASHRFMKTKTIRNPINALTITQDRSDFLYFSTELPRSDYYNPLHAPEKCAISMLAATSNYIYIYVDGKYRGKIVPLYTKNNIDIVSTNIGMPPNSKTILFIVESYGAGIEGRDVTKEKQEYPFIRGILGDIMVCGKNITNHEWVIRRGLPYEYGSIHFFNTTNQEIATKRRFKISDFPAKNNLLNLEGSEVYHEYINQHKSFAPSLPPFPSIVSSDIPKTQLKQVSSFKLKALGKNVKAFPEYSLGYYKANINISKKTYKNYVFCMQSATHGRMYVNSYDIGLYNLKVYSVRLPNEKLIKGYSQQCYQIPFYLLIDGQNTFLFMETLMTTDFNVTMANTYMYYSFDNTLIPSNSLETTLFAHAVDEQQPLHFLVKTVTPLVLHDVTPVVSSGTDIEDLEYDQSQVDKMNENKKNYVDYHGDRDEDDNKSNNDASNNENSNENNNENNTENSNSNNNITENSNEDTSNNDLNSNDTNNNELNNDNTIDNSNIDNSNIDNSNNKDDINSNINESDSTITTNTESNSDSNDNNEIVSDKQEVEIEKVDKPEEIVADHTVNSNTNEDSNIISNNLNTLNNNDNNNNDNKENSNNDSILSNNDNNNNINTNKKQEISANNNINTNTYNDSSSTSSTTNNNNKHPSLVNKKNHNLIDIVAETKLEETQPHTSLRISSSSTEETIVNKIDKLQQIVLSAADNQISIIHNKKVILNPSLLNSDKMSQSSTIVFQRLLSPRSLKKMDKTLVQKIEQGINTITNEYKNNNIHMPISFYKMNKHLKSIDTVYIDLYSDLHIRQNEDIYFNLHRFINILIIISLLVLLFIFFFLV